MSSLEVVGYSVDEQIASNSRSSIYRGRDEAGQPAILKVLNDDYPSPGALARFRREFELTRKLDCPGVVDAIALDKYANSLVMVLEDFGGEALARRIERRRPGLETCLGIVLDIAEALDEIHSRGVIHRDLNPANIVWNRDDDILKIIDFGIAITHSQQKAMPDVASELDGTLPYISPEQTGRTARSVDYRSDFYSLGVTFYELLTGQRPFHGDDPMELVHAHLAHRPPDPSELVPEIPTPVTEIVTKLMAKDPEDRYQSAYGLRADLRRCLEQMRATGTVADVEIGDDDVRQTLRIPERLYGRDNQRKQLLECFERVAEGTRELMLVAGYSGIGKSALVQSLYEPLTQRRGHFIRGKFGQVQRDVPYHGIVEALRDLVEQIAASDESRLPEQKRRIQEAVEPNGQLIVDLVPELEWLIGSQPSVPEMPPSEAKTLQMHVFRQFIGACCHRSQPLVMFIDDLQRADRASLRLLEGLLTDDAIHHLLILGAYRHKPVDSSHPLARTVESLRDDRQAVGEIKLQSLSCDDVEELVGDTVQRRDEDVEQLAALVYRKTGGNPFFVTHFIERLGDDGLIVFDRDRGRWHWDLERLQAEDITGNVVDLVIDRLQQLPGSTRTVLKWAALLGNRFDLEDVTAITDMTTVEAWNALGPALDANVVDPMSEPELIGAGDEEVLATVKLKFPHDRIQQAAAELFDEEAQIEAHRRLGELFVETLSEQALQQRLFEVVGHLNAARERFEGPPQRLRLARLNLQAGRRALHSQAHNSADRYLQIALESLPNDAWETLPELTTDIHLAAVDAKGAIGDFEEADKIARHAIERVDDPLSKAQLYNLAIRYLGQATRRADAVDMTAEGLAVLGVDYPLTDLEDAIVAKLERIETELAERRLDSLIDAPACDDDEIRAAQRILATADMVTSLYDPQLMATTVLTSFELSLQYGMSAESGTGASGYAMLLCDQGDYETAYDAARLAVDLGDRFHNLSNKTVSCCVLGAFVTGWSRHIRQAIPVLEEGFEAGASSGSNMSYAGYAQYLKTALLFFAGINLEQVLDEARFGSEFSRKANNITAADNASAIYLAARNLTGKTPDKFSFECDRYEDADAVVAACDEHDNNYGLCAFLLYRGQLQYLYGDSQGAVEYLREAEPLLDFMIGNIETTKFGFYMALALADIAAETSSSETIDQIRPLRDRLAELAESCPENFAHKLHLVDAEIARVEGDVASAIDHYDRAIKEADDAEFVHLTALANERAAIFWRNRQKPRLARLYLLDALYWYRTWGADRKVDDLEERFDEILAEAPNPSTRYSTTTWSTGTIETGLGTSQMTGSSGLGQSLDALSVIKISQTIAGELELDQLLTSLMEVTIENAGAQHGALFWPEDFSSGTLVVAVEATSGADEPDVLPETPLEEWTHGPRSIINFVQRSGQMVVIGDIEDDERFNSDPFLSHQSVRSVLCLPVEHRGETRGILYLAHELGRDAFTPRHVEVLEVLASQSAIALENANLVRDLKQENAARRQAEHQLEQTLQEVEAARDEALRASEAKSKFLATMSHELRTPLNAIIGYSDLLSEEIEAHFDAPPEFVAEDVTNINKAGHHLLSLINNLLNISKIEAGRMDVDVSEFRVETVIEEALVDLGVDEHNDNELIVDIASDAGIMRSDRSKVRLCIANLVENAEKFTEDGTIHLRATRQRRDSRNWVVIEVEDTGIGIAPEDQEAIYERFTQVDSSFTRRYDGTGLGLTVTQKCCRNLGGTITLESELGVGSTFTISLPVDIESTKSRSTTEIS